MQNISYLWPYISLISFSMILNSQDFSNLKINGYFETNGAYYLDDQVIGAQEVEEKFRHNTYFNVTMNYNQFDMGFRYEAYQRPLLGYDAKWEGEGFPYLYLGYKSDLIDVTVGSFYEQFGSGMILRIYEERNLGIDNALNGLRAKIRPTNGVEVTAIYGRARTFFDLSKSIIRGLDVDVNINDLLFKNSNNDFLFNNQFYFGVSAVSRYQNDNNSSLNLPENVFSYALRAGGTGNFYSFDFEYMYKSNDPVVSNQNSYDEGLGVKVLGSLFKKGMSFNFNYHYVETLDFRADRQGVILDRPLNFVPPLTRQQTYLLTTVFPYGTQPNGETGIGMDFTYTAPRKSILGGKYGTQFTVNFSQVYNIDSTALYTQVPNKDTSIVHTFNSNIFQPGDSLYYRELNLDISKKFSKKFKGSLSYINAQYNRDVVEFKDTTGYVYSNIFIAEGTYKFNKKNALRMEFQTLFYADDGSHEKKWKKNQEEKAEFLKENPDGEFENHIDPQAGNWLAGTIEYTFAPHYYLTYIHQYNYSNENADLRTHYPTLNFTYVFDATRIMMGYSRIRGGLLCVGGVCREVPSSNGFNFTLSTSF